MTGVPFVNPANPGTYPANVSNNATQGFQARAEAEHKELVKEYKSYHLVLKKYYDPSLPSLSLPSCFAVVASADAASSFEHGIFATSPLFPLAVCLCLMPDSSSSSPLHSQFGLQDPPLANFHAAGFWV
jgi:hypothetical protein